jgi:hypothetical protein
VVHVFLPNQKNKTAGSTVSREHATELVEQGLACWINRGTGIRLTDYRETVRGASCMIGTSVIEGNAVGIRRSVDLVDALRQGEPAFPRGVGA